MITAGDELGRSQRGNNNAYCQDNETSWLDWTVVDEPFLRFVQRVIQLRKDHPDFCRTSFFLADRETMDGRILFGSNSSGQEMQDSDWHNPNLSSFGCTFGEHDRFQCFFNASAEDQAIGVSREPGVWDCILDSSNVGHAMGTVAAHSLMIFKKARA